MKTVSRRGRRGVWTEWQIVSSLVLTLHSKMAGKWKEKMLGPEGNTGENGESAREKGSLDGVANSFLSSADASF